MLFIFFSFYFFAIPHFLFFSFFFNDTATTEIYTLSLHDALPIWQSSPSDCSRSARRARAHFSGPARSEEHTSELQSRPHLVCRLLLEKKKNGPGWILPFQQTAGWHLSDPGGGYSLAPFFFFNDPATTEIYTLSLHDALPIYLPVRRTISLSATPCFASARMAAFRSEEHTSELQSRPHLVCRLLLEKKKK